jgi:hypothetical protein
LLIAALEFESKRRHDQIPIGCRRTDALGIDILGAVRGNEHAVGGDRREFKIVL